MQGHSLYRDEGSASNPFGMIPATKEHRWYFFSIHMKGILDEASVLAHLKYALVAIVREAVC